MYVFVKQLTSRFKMEEYLQIVNMAHAALPFIKFYSTPFVQNNDEIHLLSTSTYSNRAYMFTVTDWIVIILLSFVNCHDRCVTLFHSLLLSFYPPPLWIFIYLILLCLLFFLSLVLCFDCLTSLFCVYALSLIHIWRCRRDVLCRSRWSPYH